MKLNAYCILAIALVLIQPLAVAMPSGAQSSVTLLELPTSVNVASQTGHILITSADNEDAAYYLLDPTGKTVLQEGDFTPQGCLINCDYPGKYGAISANGTRFVVAGESNQNIVLVFGTRTQGETARVTISGDLLGLQMDATGSRIAVLVDVPGISTNPARVYGYEWSATAVTEKFSHGRPEIPQVIKMSADGSSISLMEQGAHVRLTWVANPTAIKDVDIAGTATALAIANDSLHTAVLTSGTGIVQIYDDASQSNSRRFKFLSGSDSISSVAISADGTRFAIATDKMKVTVYGYERSTATMTAIKTATYTSSVSSLQALTDGFLVRTNSNLIHLSSLSSYETSFSAAVPQADGTPIATSSLSFIHLFAGKKLTTYLPEESFTISAKDLTVPGGAIYQVEVTVTNTGNRISAPVVNIQSPAEWAAVSILQFGSIRPDQNQTRTFEIAVPSGYAPQNFTLNFTSGAIKAQSKVQIPQIEFWSSILNGTTGPSVGVRSEEKVQFAVDITNFGNFASEPTLNLSQTGTWTTSVTKPGSIPVGDTGRALITITVPATQSQGASIAPKLVVEGQNVTLPELVVGAEYGFAMFGPNLVGAQANKTIELKLRVVNEGNAQDGYTLRAIAIPTGWNVVVPTGSVSVKAGEEAEVAIAVTAPATGSEDLPVLLRIQGESVSNASILRNYDVRIQYSAAPVKPIDEAKPAPGVGLIPIVALLGLIGVARKRNS